MLEDSKSLRALSALSPGLVEVHNLQGLLYSMLPEAHPLLEKYWRRNFATNAERSAELKLITGQFTGQLGVVKGMGLVGDLYIDPGARFMCDMDLWVEEARVEELEAFLYSLGYHGVPETRWYGNDFKRVYHHEKKNSVVEVHSGRLLFFDNQLQWEWVEKGRPLQLTPEHMLLHLVGHYAIQHGLDNLTQFFDIVFFLKKHHSTFDYADYFHAASKIGAVKASKKIFHVLRYEFDVEVPESFTERGLSFAELANIPHTKWRRWYLKHILRDRPSDAFLYDYRWVKQKIFQ
jgi:Uncharacterised nucleotidyltransferase